MYIHYNFVNAGTTGVFKDGNITLIIYECTPRPPEGTHLAQLLIDGFACSGWRITGQAIQAVCEGRCVEIPMSPELYAQLDEAGNLDLETDWFLEAVE